MDAEQAPALPFAAGLNALGQQANTFRCQVASGLQQRFDGVVRNVSQHIDHARKRRDDAFEWQINCQRKSRRILLPGGRFGAIIPGNTPVEQVITTGLTQFFSIYNTAIIVRLVLTWFPNPPQVIAQPLSQICDPYLNLFRGIIPPINGTIDLSPILAFIALDFFSNTAAALPAEIGPDGKPLRPVATSPLSLCNKSMTAWKRRLDAQRSRRQQQKASQQEQQQ